MRVITEFGCPARRGGETQLLPINLEIYAGYGLLSYRPSESQTIRAN
ncbi:hypothetical protein NEIMUCOT_05546 [Neisseria mucosa ATCC 25996]|uniref:Uncharacterized protein n=1 Tax=Neisseria mucosa (strain ATCC 25996 / DSM 4631 / NCTC 10774 / M26) TaxID=546266 RepID=D2ZY39_NEIM2|nr:hypothetical protein NEIMUCOT_05546 [Neisseria mucosa ATCC 25996]